MRPEWNGRVCEWIWGKRLDVCFGKCSRRWIADDIQPPPPNTIEWEGQGLSRCPLTQFPRHRCVARCVEGRVVGLSLRWSCLYLATGHLFTFPSVSFNLLLLPKNPLNALAISFKWRGVEKSRYTSRVDKRRLCQDPLNQFTSQQVHTTNISVQVFIS